MPLIAIGPASAHITRFGGPEVLDVVDVPEPVPGPGQELFDAPGASAADFRC